MHLYKYLTLNCLEYTRDISCYIEQCTIESVIMRWYLASSFINTCVIHRTPCCCTYVRIRRQSFLMILQGEVSSYHNSQGRGYNI